jgi:phosphosulfolactate phosphohydrolase-like enzyme
MQIKILWPWEISEDLDGIAVVTDVWGATTNISLLLEKKVKKLILVNSSNVKKAKNEYQNALVIGESTELPKNFFDASNLPSDVANSKANNKTVLYMSNNGTKIIELVLNKRAKKVIPVSFLNIKAVTDYLMDINEKLYLIPAGDLGKPVDEDLYCVDALEKMLKRRDVNLEEAQEKSKSFIRVFYADKTFDENLNFNFTFNLNSTNIMATCNQNQQGFIEIQSYT